MRVEQDRWDHYFKSLSVSHSEDKHVFTPPVAVSNSGDPRPCQAIYAGPPLRSLPAMATLSLEEAV